MNNNHLIIMAGGIGSRFWPMSTPRMPKQFIDVLGVGRSLLQLTVDRFKGLIPIENVWVVTSKNYMSIVAEQLNGISKDQILLEPCMRNTAPCIAYVTWKIKKRFPSANLVFSPADHIVLNPERFREVIAKGLEFTANFSSIVTLGMEPTRAETGYGYIKARDVVGEIRKVEAFKEKPCLEVAQEYVAEGSYFWNAGIFIWNVDTIVQEFVEFVPDLANRFEKLIPIFYSANEQSVIDVEFPLCESISIDYAVMERSKKTYVFPASFGWSDLGTWGSLYAQLDKDVNGNAIVGNDVRLVGCSGCVVHTPKERKVVLQGLDGYIVAEHNDTLLVCKMEEEQGIREWGK